jgi:titin
VNDGAWTYVDQTGTTLTRSGLTPGAKIGVEVKALNADAESPFSTEGTATMDAAAPGAPSAPNVSSSAAGTFTATWSAPSATGGKSITSYDLQFRVNGGAWTYVADVASGYTRADLTPGAAIGVQVRARNPDATGPYSDEGKSTMMAAAPSAPDAPSVTSSAPGEFRATWSAPSSDGGKPITAYNLRYQVDGGSWTTASNVTSGYTKSGLTPGGALNVQVQAENADATSSWSTTGSADMLAGGRVKGSTTWGDAVTWLKVGGVWAKHRVWAKSGGVWAPYR